MAKVALIGMYDNWTLGLRTLSNALISNGHEVSIIHFKMPAMYNRPFFLKHTLQYQTLNTGHARDQVVVNWYNTDAVMWTYNEVQLLGDLLLELSPDIIGLSTRCVYERSIMDIIGQMKRVDRAITVAGGHDASFRPELYLDHLDFVCIGEGEEALVRLAETADGRGEARDINNLAYKNNGEIITNNLMLPLDEKDYFFTEGMREVTHYLIDGNRITEVDFLFRDITFQTNVKEYYTMAGRGCTGTCTFCSAGQFQRLYTRQGLPLKARRLRPVENIIQETLYAKELGFTKVYFLDSFFLARKEYLLSFFEAYRRVGGLPFFAQLQPEQILAHPEILEEALKAGLEETVIGIQSGSERINKEVFNRKTPHDKIVKFADMLTGRANLKVDYHLITHNPFEKQEDFEETLSLLKRLPKKQTYLILRPLYAFANTEIHKMIENLKPVTIDIEAQYKLLMLYLIRYSVPDHEFEKIRARFEEMSLNDLSQAYAELKKFYKCDSDWVNYGMQLLNNGDFEASLTAFDSALELNPKYFDALNGKGWAYIKKGDFAQAGYFFQEALNQYPRGNYTLWVGMIEVLERAGRLHDVIKCALKARELVSPYNARDYSTILLKLGWAFYQIGEGEQAKDYYSEALQYVDEQTGDQLRELLAKLERATRASSETRADGPPLA